MKKPGVLGGLGPQTTADYYLRIQELATEEGLLARPPMLTWSVPLPYDLENESIFEGTGFDEIGEYLADGAELLEKAGADFIVMPCNSLHICAEQIKSRIKVPFLSILDETVDYIKKTSYLKIAILGTEQTVKHGLYTDALIIAGKNVLLPSIVQQKQLNEMVVRLINGKQTSDDQSKFGLILDTLTQQGAEVILLACTDFHILFEDKDVPFIDTMEVLAQSTFREILQDA